MEKQKLQKFIEKMNLTEDDVLKALLSVMIPCQPNAIRQNWLVNERFNNKAPMTDEIWNKFCEADFQCSCGSHFRLSLDHIDGDTSDCSDENIQVLCFDCNRAKSKKQTKNKNHKLKIYKAIVDIIALTGEFPDNKKILKEAGIDQLGGSTYMVKVLKHFFSP